MEKKIKSYLTHEDLGKKFKSNFDLVNYAIQLAENMIKTGRDPRVKSDIQNRAMLILEEINEGRDQLDEVKEAKTRFHSEFLNGMQSELIDEEQQVDKRRYRTAEVHDEE